MAVISATHDTEDERVHLIAGTSNENSPLSVMLLRGDKKSNIHVDNTNFFAGNVTNLSRSIEANGMIESHGFTLFNVKNPSSFKNSLFAVL